MLLLTVPKNQWLAALRDSVTLFGGVAVDVMLIGNAFTPAYNLDPATLVQIDNSDDAGLGSIHIGTANAVLLHDPVTDQDKLVLPPPVGGWRWSLQADHALGLTVYGFAVTFTASNGDQTAGIRAAEVLPEPWTGYIIGDELVVPEVGVVFPTPFMI